MRQYCIFDHERWLKVLVPFLAIEHRYGFFIIHIKNIFKCTFSFSKTYFFLLFGLIFFQVFFFRFSQGSRSSQFSYISVFFRWKRIVIIIKDFHEIFLNVMRTQKSRLTSVSGSFDVGFDYCVCSNGWTAWAYHHGGWGYMGCTILGFKGRNLRQAVACLLGKHCT